MPAEIPDGAVIVARAIVNSSLWKMRPADRVVAVTCLAIANKKAKKWFDGYKQLLIQRGQFVRSRSEMAQECGLPIQVVRTSLDHLADSEFLTRDLTKAYTIYTIPKYQHYQDLTKYSDYGVIKLTKDPTRLQPGISSKSNQGFAQAVECKHLGSQGVPELCKLCGENPTSEILKTNHKQQHQTQSPSLSSSDSRRGGDPGRNGSVVVVDPDRWADPILALPSYLFSLKLLDELKMAKSVAMTLASQKPVGIILRVVDQAKRQLKPAGWARMALENGWVLPEAPATEISKAIELLKIKLPKNITSRSDSMREKFPRKSGESEDQWFKRVSQELVATKKGVKKS